MRRKRPFPSSSPHSAQAESRTIQNTTISSRTELVPTLGSALTNVEFLSTLTSQSNVTRASGGTPHAGQSSSNQWRPAKRTSPPESVHGGQEQTGGLPCRGVDQSSVAQDPQGLPRVSAQTR